MGSASSNRVDPLYLKVATPRVTDGGRNALPSARDLFKGLSVSSQFKVSLHLNRNVTGAKNLDGHLTRSGIFDEYSSSSMSYDFFASEAILPGVNFDMTEQPGSYQGMLEYMPTRRVWPDFEVTFYIDDQYNILRLFEEWVNYINPLYSVNGQYSGGSNAQDGMVDTNSYYKLRYPGKYKRKISITKFERSFFNNPNSSSSTGNAQPLLSYQLIDAFPKQVTAVPVSYDGSTLSRVTIIFGYTRYITVKNNGGKTSSNSVIKNTVSNSKVYVPTQAIVTKRQPSRPLTEGAKQRKDNIPNKWTNSSYEDMRTPEDQIPNASDTYDYPLGDYDEIQKQIENDNKLEPGWTTWSGGDIPGLDFDNLNENNKGNSSDVTPSDTYDYDIGNYDDLNKELQNDLKKNESKDDGYTTWSGGDIEFDF